MKNVALVLSGMVFGGALLVATQQVSAQAQRRPPPLSGMRWEQTCEAAATLQDGNKLAAARGQQGWELVSFVNGAMCFKRPASGRGEPSQAIDPSPAVSGDDWGY